MADTHPTRSGNADKLTPFDSERGREAAHERWRRFRENREAITQEAQERAAAVIAAALEDGALQIANLAQNADSEQVRLAASRDLLDRYGLKSTDKLELTGKDGGPVEVARADLDPELVIRKLSEIGLVRGREQ